MKEELKEVLEELDTLVQEIEGEEQEHKEDKESMKSKTKSTRNNNKNTTSSTKHKKQGGEGKKVKEGSRKSRGRRKVDVLDKEKQELKKVKELKRSIDLLEKEVFIRIENPSGVVEELKRSKMTLKDITQTLMAVAKINKLKEDLIITLNKQIYELKESVKNLEDGLNVKEELLEETYVEGMDIDLVDNIESDIEEIRKNIGLAK